MSMNLILFSGDKEIPLWQTPTFITWMCLSMNKSGRFDGGNEGVRRRYLHWVDGHLNGVWTDQEDFEATRENVREHKAEILAVRRPRFSCV